MDTGLKGRTVLITGASRNMGPRALGVSVVAEKCDVTDAAAVARFVSAARKTLGTVHVAINLAGYRAEAPLLEETLDAWERTIAVNLTGPFHVCRAVLPLMKEQRWGRIINVSGVAPYLGIGAAKAAVKLRS